MMHQSFGSRIGLDWESVAPWDWRRRTGTSTWADCSLLHALTGYQPNTDLKFGVSQFVAWFLEYKKTLVCEMCGHGHPPSVLDFHHTDEKTKTMAVSQMVNEGYSQKRILAEIDKCMVLCANHHRELHSNQRTIE